MCKVHKPVIFPFTSTKPPPFRQNLLFTNERSWTIIMLGSFPISHPLGPLLQWGRLLFSCYFACRLLYWEYHRLTRADTVLTGRNAPILRQAPWQYGKYYLRVFSCLDTFLLRQNCYAPASDVFSSDFWLLRCRRAESAYSRRCCRATFLWSEADARQDEKDKKRRKDTLSGVFALVNRW